MEQITQLARDYGTTKPAAIRLNYGMQRARGGGNAGARHRLPARAGGCLAPPCRRAAAVHIVQCPRRSARACTCPQLLGQRRPRTINMSTIGDALLGIARAARS